MRVQEIMTQNPAYCTTASSLQDAARMMRDCDCGAIPVVEDEGQQPVGIITDRDIVIRAIADGKVLSDVTVGEIMTRDVVTVDAEADMDEAARLMKEHKIRRLMVTRNGSGLIGMLAQADLAMTGRDSRTGDVVEEISEGANQSGSGRF